MKENEYLQGLSVSVIARHRVCFPRAHVWDGEWTWGRKLVCLLTVKICDSGKSNPPFDFMFFPITEKVRSSQV